jgi:hypothetical protein
VNLQTTWRSWVVAVFGAWFVVDSFFYAAAKDQSSVFWSFLVIGALILIGSVWLALQAGEASWRAWVVAILSAWMAVSPWALKFSSHSTDTWVTLVVGVLGVLGSVWAATGAQSAPSTGASRSA